MAAETLEHKVLGPGNFADNVAEFERWDSISDIQARRAGTHLGGLEPEFERWDSISDIQARRAGTHLDGLEPETSPETMQRHYGSNSPAYGSNAPAYSMRNGKHILEIYDFNDENLFPDKSESVRTIRAQGYQLSKLQDLKDETKVVNLSDEGFNRFVTIDNDNYSHITYELADAKEGIIPFEGKYGAEATKLFTVIHGEDVYSEQGVKGRFREGQETANIYFQSRSIIEARLDGQEEGTKVLRGAYLRRRDDGSIVYLVSRFNTGYARVSGVVKKSGVAGDAEKGPQLMPYKTAQDIMAAETLEHKVLGPDNFADNVAEFERWDSISDIQARRAGMHLDGLEPEISPETMQRQWYYGSNAPAHSMRNGKHTLEIYDFNDENLFPDKSESVRTIRAQGYQLSKLQDLKDQTKVVNLSDKRFNRFVTRDNDNYSHITFKLSDVVGEKEHFEETYGIEATKLFTAMHGEEVYSGQGVKGRFREGQETVNIYFQNQSITEARLDGQEEGTKVLRGAYLGRHDLDSSVDLDGRFGVDYAHVSGVVRKSGVAGDAEKGPQLMPYKTAQDELKKLVQPTSPLFKPMKEFVDRIYRAK